MFILTTAGRTTKVLSYGVLESHFSVFQTHLLH